MLINCNCLIRLFIHLLIVVPFLVHFSHCNWLRIGVSDNLDLPQSDYIKHFNRRQMNRNQKKMHLNRSSHPPHRKLIATLNDSIVKYLNSSNISNDLNDTFFVNDLTESIRPNEEYDQILSQFNSGQLKFIKQNPNSLNVINEAASLAIQQCAARFSKERWNCSIEDENEVFAHTLKRGNRETAFVQAIVSAGLTYSLTKACSTGNLQNCACEYKYERFSDQKLTANNQQNWHWAGCSDNLAFGISLSKQFLDSSIKEKRTKNRAALKEMMNLHNNNAGREAIKKLMRLKCRCHGLSGSCQLTTCWHVLPNFDDVGKYLKTKYLNSVRIKGIVNQGSTFKLKRIRRSNEFKSTKNFKAPSSNLDLNDQMNQANHQRSKSNKMAITANKVIAAQFSGIELNADSFVVNNEIDQDDDYSDEEDYFDQDDEVKGKRITDNEEKPMMMNSQTSRQVISRPTTVNTGDGSKRFIANQANKVDDRLNVGRDGKLDIGGDVSASKKAKSKVNRSNRSNGRKQTEQVTINQTVKKTKTKKRVINSSMNEIDLDFGNIFKNVVEQNVNQKVTKSKDRLETPAKLDLVYAYDSPNYCSANDYLKILGTVHRVCRKTTTKKYSDNCESLCCGRGYDKRIVHRSEECQCEFDAVSVGVKCKTCEFAFENFTCK